MKLYASSFVLGELEHPNKLPFSGVLTTFDAMSDRAPNGSGGLKVVIPSEVGIPALTSLIGMAVNYVPGTMDNHDPHEKIGVITAASAGDPDATGARPVYIEGYVYAHDYEQAAVQIKLNQSLLGFSYETAQTQIETAVWNGSKVALVKDVGYFTGASILLKDSAAYASTSLAASADDTTEKEVDLSVEQTQIILDAITALREYVDAKFALLSERQYRDDVTEMADQYVEQAIDTVIEAADAIEEIVETLEDAGAVSDDSDVVIMAASDDAVVETVVDETVVEDEAAVQDGVTPEDVQAAEVEIQAAADVQAIRDELEAAKTELAELKASRRSVAYPTTLAAKYDLVDSGDTASLMASIDNRTDLDVDQRLALKFELREKARKQA